MSVSTHSLVSKFSPTDGRISESLKHRSWPRLALILVLVIASARDLVLVAKHPLVIGIDGYYYVLQISEILQQGHLYFPSKTPLLPYSLAAVSYLTGNSIFIMKVAAVVLHLLLCLGIFALLATTTRSEWLGAIGAGIGAFSGLHFYMLSEFIGSLMAIMFLLWCVWCLVKFVETRRKAWAACSIILFLGAAFSHRLSFVFLLLSALFTWELRWLRAQESLKKRYVALLSIPLLWLLPVVVVHVSTSPKWLNAELSVRPRWPFDNYALGEEIIVLLAGGAVIFLLVYFKDRLMTGAAAYLFGVIALVSLVITLNPFLDPERGWLSVAGRLRGLTYIQASIIVPGLVWYLLSIRREIAFYVLAAASALMVFSITTPLPRGMQLNYLREREQLMDTLPTSRANLGENPIVIAAHGEEFMVTALLGVPSQQTPPVTSQYENIYWLIHYWTNKELTASTIVIKPDSPSTATVFIEDHELRQQVDEMDALQRRRLFAMNPHLARLYNSVTSG